MKKLQHKQNLDEFGGSCIIDKVHGRRDTDYDGCNDYNGFTVENMDY